MLLQKSYRFTSHIPSLWTLINRRRMWTMSIYRDRYFKLAVRICHLFFILRDDSRERDSRSTSSKSLLRSLNELFKMYILLSGSPSRWLRRNCCRKTWKHVNSSAPLLCLCPFSSSSLVSLDLSWSSLNQQALIRIRRATILFPTVGYSVGTLIWQQTH